MFEKEALHDGFAVLADVILQQKAAEDEENVSGRLSLGDEKLALSIVSLYQQPAPRLRAPSSRLAYSVTLLKNSSVVARNTGSMVFARPFAPSAVMAPAAQINALPPTDRLPVIPLARKVRRTVTPLSSPKVAWRLPAQKRMRSIG